MIGLVPLACVGNDCFSRSVARWLLVPGNDRLSLVLSPICLEMATSATAATSQTTRTMAFRRTQKGAIRYRTPAMSRLSPDVWNFRCRIVPCAHRTRNTAADRLGGSLGSTPVRPRRDRGILAIGEEPTRQEG